MGYLEQDDLIGHAVERAFLARSLAKGRHHAYLFSGAEHLGKETIARAFVADELNRPVNAWSDLAGHPDVKILAREEGEKNIGVAQVRDFIAHFSSSSMWGGRKIGVLLGVHDLSTEAGNALLKTLEEPAGNALMVLVADSLDRLPETIKSRCQAIRFLSVPTETVVKGLLQRGIDSKTAEASAVHAAGRPGLALMHAGDEVYREKYRTTASAMVDLITATPCRRMTLAAALTAKAETATLATTLDHWLAVARDAITIKSGNDRYVSEHAAVLRTYVAKKTMREIANTARTILSAKKMLAENVNPRLIFENIALSL